MPHFEGRDDMCNKIPALLSIIVGAVYAMPPILDNLYCELSEEVILYIL